MAWDVLIKNGTVVDGTGAAIGLSSLGLRRRRGAKATDTDADAHLPTG